MADLDDFFAKKDRKKAKGKKFTTTEEIAKKLEETGKKIEKPKPKEKPVNPEGGDENQQVEEEDEWKDFEEEKKDYSGLKIGNLTVTAKSDNDEEDEKNAGETGSDGESGESSGKHSGPWKKADAPPQEQSEPQPQPRPQPAAPAAPSTGGSGGGSYKIPALRNAPPSYDRERPMGRPRGKNIAPDINSEEYFPTLNSKLPANDAAGAWGRKKRDEGTFEEVRNRGGSRTYNTPEAQTQAPKLSLGNKYGALPQDQS